VALFKSSLLASVSGSVGGTVYSRNRGGAYTRNRTIPTYSQSPTQGFILAINVGLNGDWDGLGLQNQSRWTDWASSHPVVNRLGDERRQTGREAFLHLNFYRVLSGEAVLILPPDLGPRGDLTNVIAPLGGSVDADSDTGTIFFLNQAKLQGYTFAFTSDGISPGSFSVKRPLRYFGYAFSDDNATVDVSVLYADRRVFTFPSRFVLRLVHQDNLGYVSADWVGIIAPSN